MLQKRYYIYILSTWNHKVIYVGITNDLRRRLYEHQHELVDGFTKRYHVHKLVYYESTEDPISAITREKEIKGWSRAKKNALIESKNPNWEEITI